jgi:hypothetical protein
MGEREVAACVAMPEAFERKAPRTPFEILWQWVFPATRVYRDPRTDR